MANVVKGGVKGVGKRAAVAKGINHETARLGADGAAKCYQQKHSSAGKRWSADQLVIAQVQFPPYWRLKPENAAGNVEDRLIDANTPKEGEGEMVYPQVMCGATKSHNGCQYILTSQGHIRGNWKGAEQYSLRAINIRLEWVKV